MYINDQLIILQLFYLDKNFRNRRKGMQHLYNKYYGFIFPISKSYFLKENLYYDDFSYETRNMC